MGNKLHKLLKSDFLKTVAPIFPLLLGVAVTLGAWHWQRDERVQLDRWHQEALECQSLAAGIMGLRNKPKSVVDRVVDSRALAGYIEHAARNVGMGQTHICSIHPDYPRRIGSTPYVETSTRVRLTEVSISDAARLIWNLRRESPGLNIPQLRMWSEPTKPATWEVELEVVALAYSPSQE